MANILKVTNLNKSFGALHATDNLSLEIEEGTIHGLIGPNGAGKTTAISQLSGELMPDRGTIEFDGQDVTRWPIFKRAQFGLQRSYQITSLFPDFTALDNVAIAIQATDGHSFRFWGKAREDKSLIDPAMDILKQVGLDHLAHRPVTDLAHGQQRQIELAMTLATKPKMLLLDEPMAGMGKTESHDMMEVLRPLKGNITILMVEHDMDVVFALADKISVLVRGHCIVTGTPDEIRTNADVRTAYLGEG
ncbi:ABC transporter ATP-binding protein [Terasakiella pusilla]|uniref:ABC transporter ATP-binding protein n=1 Tax=Terasakiella pusilla TaxID=64973 RepID=UPI003AA863F3